MTTSANYTKQKLDEVDMLEEDDEFEEFERDTWEKDEEDQEDERLWEDNWDDDHVDDEFANHLRKELNEISSLFLISIFIFYIPKYLKPNGIQLLMLKFKFDQLLQIQIKCFFRSYKALKSNQN